MRRALGFAAGLTAILGLAQPVLAATTPVTSTKSTVLAGYNFADYIGVPGAVSATLVVPKLNCKATPPAGTVDLRRRRHPIRELLRPSVPSLHAERRSTLLPIARSQWHHHEHR